MWASVLCGTSVGADGAPDPIREGWQYVRYYEFDRAEPYFREVLETAEANSDRWKEATFGLAVSLHHKRPPTASAIQEAAKLFRELAEKDPNEKFAPRALMNLARIHELRDYFQDVIELDKARAIYRKVIESYGDRPIVDEAVLRLAQSHINTFQTDQVNQGVKVLTDWLAKHPENSLAGLMWVYLGDVYFYPLGDSARCVAAYVEADRRNSLEPGQEGVFYWRIANLADSKLNNRDLAIVYYTKLITEVPSQGKGYQSQLALKRLGVPEEQIPNLEWAPKPKEREQMVRQAPTTQEVAQQ